jgi:hypothetical protein
MVARSQSGQNLSKREHICSQINLAVTSAKESFACMVMYRNKMQYCRIAAVTIKHTCQSDIAASVWYCGAMLMLW